MTFINKLVPYIYHIKNILFKLEAMDIESYYDCYDEVNWREIENKIIDYIFNVDLVSEEQLMLEIDHNGTTLARDLLVSENMGNLLHNYLYYRFVSNWNIHENMRILADVFWKVLRKVIEKNKIDTYTLRQYIIEELENTSDSIKEWLQLLTVKNQLGLTKNPQISDYVEKNRDNVVKIFG